LNSLFVIGERVHRFNHAESNSVGTSQPAAASTLMRKSRIIWAGKGSTENAAHSHTPLALKVWEEFDGLIAAEGDKTESRRVLDIDFQRALTHVRLKVVKAEDDITDNLERVLLTTSHFSFTRRTILFR